VGGPEGLLVILLLQRAAEELIAAVAQKFQNEFLDQPFAAQAADGVVIVAAHGGVALL
jgi:hypothetical protein